MSDRLSVNLGRPVRTGHRREQPEPRRRAQSHRAAVRERRAAARPEQHRTASRLHVRGDAGDDRAWRVRHLLRPRRPADPVARARSRRSRAAGRSAGWKRLLHGSATGTLPPGAPTLSNPFTGFILPGAGASGINIIDSHLQNPSVNEFNLGVGPARRQPASAR